MSTPASDGDDAGVRVRAHPGLCEGWGNCHRWAPDVYPLDDDGQIAIHLLEVDGDHAAAAWIGADACPVRAITVIGVRAPSPRSRTAQTTAEGSAP